MGERRVKGGQKEGERREKGGRKVGERRVKGGRNEGKRVKTKGGWCLRLKGEG